MAKIIVDELVTLVSLQTTKQSAQAIKSVENGMRSMKKLALVATGALTGFAFAMTKVVGGVDQKAKFAAGIGISVENLQELEFAAQKAGASADEMNGFLDTLTKTMTSTIPGEYNTALQQLGISATDANGKARELVPTILEISKGFRELDQNRKQQFAARLGAGSRIANFLGQDPKEILKAMKEAQNIGGVLPGNKTKAAAELIDDSLLRVKTTMKVLSQEIFISLSPAVSKLLDQFEMWLVKNKKVVESNLGEFIKAVSNGFARFGEVALKATNILDGFIKAVFGSKDGLGEMKAVSALTEVALIALAAAVASVEAPFVLFGTAIVGIMKVFPNLVKVSQSAANLYNAFFPSSVDKTTESIDAASSALERFLSLLSKINPAKGISSLFGGASDLLNQAADDISLTSKGGGTGVLDSIVRQQESIGGGTGALASIVRQQESISVPRGGSANQNTTNNVNINVSGAGSPIAVGKEVRNQFDLNTAVQTASPGFNRAKAG